MWCDSGDDCGDDCGKDCCDSYDNSEYDRGDDPCDDCSDYCGDQGVFPRNLLARASAFQSVTIQVVDWQRRKWTSIFFFLFSVVNVSHGTAALIKKPRR